MKVLKQGLIRWAKMLENKKKGLKARLTKQLKELLVEEVNNESLPKIIDIKVHLNLEIDKDETFLDQTAHAN